MGSYKHKNIKPLVTVIMPVFNMQSYVGEAIASILAQTYRNFELIIINDASTDKSFSIIKKFKKLYPRKIKVIDLEINLNRGGDRCANVGLERARGKYIARMDADDIALPDRLSHQVEYLENNPETFLVGSNTFVINERGDIIGEKNEEEKHSSIMKAFFTFNPIIHPTALFRAEFENKQRFVYKIEFSANNDYYTFFKLAAQGAIFHNLPDKLLYQRIHGTNDTFVNIKQKFLNTLRARFRIVREFGYRPTPLQIAITVLQTCVVFILPERAIRTAYLVSKGIVKIDVGKKFKSLITNVKHSSRLRFEQ